MSTSFRTLLCAAILALIGGLTACSGQAAMDQAAVDRADPPSPIHGLADGDPVFGGNGGPSAGPIVGPGAGPIVGPSAAPLNTTTTTAATGRPPTPTSAAPKPPPLSVESLRIVHGAGEFTEFIVRDTLSPPCNPMTWSFRLRYRANVSGTVDFRWYFNGKLGPDVVRQVTASPDIQQEPWNPTFYGLQDEQDLTVHVVATINGQPFASSTVHAVCQAA